MRRAIARLDRGRGLWHHHRMIAALVMAAAPLTLAQVESLPPGAAGELLLAGRAHGPIVKAERGPEGGMRPPGLVEYAFVEQARPIPGGCARTRWHASFIGSDTAPARQFGDSYATEEVALAPADACEAASYAHLQSDTTAAAAVAALQVLRRVAEGTLPVDFTCRSSIDRRLCTGPASMRAALRQAPWVVSVEGRHAEVWIGQDAVVKVRFDMSRPAQVSVTKEYAPPP